mgnify:CR=1 FL=1
MNLDDDDIWWTHNMKIREKCCCHKHHINVCFVWYKKHKNDQEKKYLWFFKGAKDDGNNLYANKSFQGKKLSRKKEQLNSCCYPKKEEFWSFNFFSIEKWKFLALTFFEYDGLLDPHKFFVCFVWNWWIKFSLFENNKHILQNKTNKRWKAHRVML